MEKKYVKPDVYVERFELSQTVAKSCGWTSDSTVGKPTQADIDVCGWDMGNFVFFATDSSCSTIFPVDTEIEGVGCYNNPNGEQTIFAS